MRFVMLNMNDYKLVVISGLKDEDGLIRFFGEISEYRFHLEALKDYMYTYYSDLAEDINADDMKHNNDLIICLNDMGNIVYLHSPGYGLLFMPKQVSKNQIMSLYNLFNSFEKTPIYIDYNLTRQENGVYPEDIVDYVVGNENYETLDNFFYKKPYVKGKVK